MKTRVISYARLRKAGACERQLRIARGLYPDGIPARRAAAQALTAVGCDVIYGALLLLGPAERRDFIVFMLRQRQPHIAALLRRADLPEHAARIDALGDDPEQMREAYGAVARAAACAARADARDAARAAADAAGDAAWAAAEDARAAARAAADAAGDAAWAAARAARDAAGDAAWAAAEDARAAAGAAAGAAACAAWDAAGDTAWAAAWAAARAAARTEQVEWCLKALRDGQEEG